VNGPEPGRSVWVDGRRVAVAEARIPLADPAVQSGTGLFETLAVEGGRMLDLPRHLERLRRGAARLGIPVPAGDAVDRATRSATAETPEGWLKILLTGGGRWYVFGGTIDPTEIGREVSAVLLPWRCSSRGPLVGIKSLSYGASRAGLDEAARRGADEGLWRNERGLLTEACAANLFVVRRGRLRTAAEREGILPGIVRSRVLEAASGLGLVAHTGKLRVPQLRAADEAFLTSSVRGVRPLVRVDGRSVGQGVAGPVTRRLAARVAELRREV
jgi:branched-subunit amino acid aminotransferase/4-amino-4-deoxychorismate lyase